MNILHLNTYVYDNNLSFPPYQYHKELLNEGHQSMLLSAKGNVKEKNIISLNRGRLLPFFEVSRIVRKVYFELIKKNESNYYYPEWNLDIITEKQIINKVDFKPDVIITYWTKFAFNQKLLYKLSKKHNVPVLCVLMDMAPLTGGCHYAYNCENYQRKCGNCPALNSDNENDLSRKTWIYKKKYIDQTDVTLIAASSTLVNQAKKSSLYKGVKIETLVSSVDEKIFKPLDRLSAKKKLEIKGNKKVIFFGASSLTDERKGFYYLVESLKILFKKDNKNYKNEDILILIAGKNFDDSIDIPFEYKYLGYLKNQEDLATAFQACDLFACPSIEDSGPIMINQSIMTGRPVVSFEMGVALDLVFTGGTGYRAKLKDSIDFAYGLDFILSADDKRWNEISNNCRKLAMDVFSLKQHSNNLNKIIDRAIKNNIQNKKNNSI